MGNVYDEHLCTPRTSSITIIFTIVYVFIQCNSYTLSYYFYPFEILRDLYQGHLLDYANVLIIIYFYAFALGVI